MIYIKTKIVLLALALGSSWLSAEVSLDKKIGSMLMVGFHGTSVNNSSQICNGIKNYNLAGVILFDYNPVDKTKPKNIQTKAQVATLTKQLQNCTLKNDLLISVDQEGGKVQRLKSVYGFLGNFPTAKEVGSMNDSETLATYTKMGKELKSAGINYDLAPVVDLIINPKNHVINGLNRAYSSDAKVVSHKAGLFIKAMNDTGVLTSLKHFPGHGSSEGDTHKGYVDVTKTWNNIELEPYKLLSNKADSVMVAHVYNAKIDTLPASLSYATVTKLLREKMGYKGVVITDDLQMGAISQKYTLRETLKLAIKAGDDILLFGNQLDPKKTVATHTLVNTIKDLVAKKEISIADIDKAYKRVQKLKSELK